MRVTLIVNPHSGRGAAARVAGTVASTLRGGQRRRIHLGSVDGGACFTTVLCTGFDAAVSARANAMRWPAGPRRYDLAVLAELAALTRGGSGWRPGTPR